MSHSAFTLLGLTAITAALVAVLVFAVFRFLSAARAARQQRDGRAETALLSAALHDAVSGLKAQERAMSARAVASEQLSAQVFDSLTAGLLVVDPDGRITTVNPAGRAMLSLNGGSAGATVQDALRHEPPIVDAVTEALSLQHQVVRRSVQLQAGERPCHVGVTISPFGDPGGRRGAICLLYDRTDIIALEEQLQTKAALAALGEMTAGLAHELRNGLATIHGYIRLIDPARVPEQYKPCVEGIRQETDTLGRVVTNFLGFARPESITLAPLDLRSVIDRAAEDLRVELPAPLTLTVAGDFGHVPGDEILLRQTFANLIRNAAEACEASVPAPSIRVEGAVDPAGRVTVVTVDDNGPGVPETHRTKIFQPFFTTRSRGSGLGLSIVQKVVLLHNGRITVGSAPGGGARMQVTFPLSDAA